MAEKSADASFSGSSDAERGLGSPQLDGPSSPTNQISSVKTDISAGTTVVNRSPSFLKKALSWPLETGRGCLPVRSSAKAPYKTMSLDDFPEGYPRVSCFLDSDESFMIYRRFGRLHARLLLHKQDQLREYEDELLQQDKQDDQDLSRKKALKSRQRADNLPAPAVGRRRQEILKDIERVLLEYGTILQQAHTFQEYSKPTNRDHNSVTTWFNNVQPVVKADRGFLLCKEDLVTIRGDSEYAWIDSFVESFLRWYPGPFLSSIFQNSETRAKTTDKHVNYFSRPRINFAVTFLITILISVLLIVPICILYYVTLHPEVSGGGNVLLIVVLLSFTLLFNCTLSLFTKFKRHEILAASVGYCAVLVVFVGNVGNVGSVSPSPSA